MPRYHIHICHPWSGCHMGGIRLNIWWHGRFIGIALTPGARYVDPDGRVRWTTRG